MLSLRTGRVNGGPGKENLHDRNRTQALLLDEMRLAIEAQNAGLQLVVRADRAQRVAGRGLGEIPRLPGKLLDLVQSDCEAVTGGVVQAVTGDDEAPGSDGPDG